jgi:uncharacterized membrane protein
MGASELEVTRTVVALALALLFVVMGILHFVPSVTRGMAAMIPPFLRGGGLFSPLRLVYLTGLCELAGAVGLVIPATRVLAAIALIVFLVAVFPANAYAAQHPERFGRAATPLIPRAIAQLVLIALLVFVAL